jgi:hypothetical protein
MPTADMLICRHVRQLVAGFLVVCRGLTLACLLCGAAAVLLCCRSSCVLP